MDQWKVYFKPEVCHSGQRLVEKGQVLLNRPSDTQVMCYVKGTTSYRVSLMSSDIADPRLCAKCTCSQAKKGLLCKHIWAVLVLIEDQYPEFLSDKVEITLDSSAQAVGQEFKQKASARSQEFKQKMKERQSEYRKRQSEWRKSTVKEHRSSCDNAKPNNDLPQDVEAALSYFMDNGFSLRDTFNLEALSVAKKKLARVFHPDRGGTHQEIVQLNENVDILVRYLK